MTDINLLQDRDTENDPDELEKKKRAARLLVELSNPRKEHEGETTQGPRGGAMSFLRRLFGGSRPPMTGVQPRARILRQDMEPHRSRKRDKKTEPREPRRQITERFAAPSSPTQPLEDVFDSKPLPLNPPIVRTERAPQPPPAEPPPLPRKKSAEASRVAFSQPSSGLQPVGNGTLPPLMEPTLGVNLVPEEMLGGPGSKGKLLSLLIVAVLCVLAVAVIYIGMVVYQNRIVDQTKEVRDSIAALDAEIGGLQADKKNAADFHTAATTIIGLLDNHVYWTKFLQGLEAYTVDDVFLRTISVDRSGRLSIVAAGRDYRAVARQLLAYQEAKDFVKDVSITAAQAVEENNDTIVNFTATITLRDKVFYRTAEVQPLFGSTTP